MMNNTEPIITIDRGGCEGVCPIYSAEIYADGIVIYRGRLFVKVAGERRFKIPKENVAELIDAFRAIDYFSLEGRYEAMVTCQPTTTTSFRFDGRKKTVENEYAGPDELEDLENRIDQLAGLTELIGDRDEY